MSLVLCQPYFFGLGGIKAPAIELPKMGVVSPPSSTTQSRELSRTLTHKNKVDRTLALVTGASSGLGKELSIALDARGTALILVARREEELIKLAKTLSLPAQILCADLSTAAGRKKVSDLIAEKSPDLIINNAGFGRYGSVLEHPKEVWEEMLSVNVQAVMDLTISGAQALKKAQKKGTILNISSAAAFFSYPTFCVYAATKAFVHRFSEGINAELSSIGIRVLTVCPGQIETEFRKTASGNFPQKSDCYTMPLAKAVRLILKQIDSGKAFSIIDWRYRWAVAIAKCLPQGLLKKILSNSLKKRHEGN